MFTLRFTRSACKEIQKLPAEHYDNVLKIIQDFQDDNLGDYKKLASYQNVWRTRKGDTRVIWTRNNDILIVIKAGSRRDVYENIQTSSIDDTELIPADILGIEPNQFDNVPTYELAKSNSSMRQFFYGGYLYSPVLTQEQQNLLGTFTILGNCKHSNSSLLIQSAPGTGKTICASLIACNLYEKLGCNVILILPDNLCLDVRQYSQIKYIKQKYNNIDFFIGTLKDWIRNTSPQLHDRIADTREQMIALQREAKRVHIANINEDDLKLYISFVYAKDEEINHRERIIYIENSKRIEELEKIQLANFKENLNEKILMVDALKQLSEELKPEHITQRYATIFIIDETQDYLCKEIKLISRMLQNWQIKHQHSTLIWLLGDINQRIQPVDFEWGDLHLSRTYALRYNYRNTQHILKFADIFYQLARKLTGRNRALPAVSSPEDAFEEGEPIKILEVSRIDEFQKLLVELSENIGKSTKSSDRYFLRKLANQVPVIYLGENLKNQHRLPYISYLSIVEAKGREFDSCILVSSGHEPKKYSLVELNQWYTAITRSRQYLLVVMTSLEIEQIGREKLQSCELYSENNLKSLVDWITRLSNVESLLKNTDEVIYKITSQVPNLYFDTYSVLNLIRADEQRIYEVESMLIAKLREYDANSLEEQLEEFNSITDIQDRVGLRCLVLRALNRSWDAVSEAFSIKTYSPECYERLLYAIAKDLESKGLPYEALRIRANVEPSVLREKNYPFAEEFPIGSDTPLVSILCKLAVTRIKEMIKNE